MEEILILKVTMIDECERTKGNPSRTIAIPEQLTLYSLAYAIVDSFGFYFDHCFGYYETKSCKMSDSKTIYELFVDLENEGDLGPDPLADDYPHVERFGVYGTLLSDVFSRKGQIIYFKFDYGDNWIFKIELLAIEKKTKNKQYPRVIKKEGRAPKQY